jgi:hypothetical protein
MKTRIRKRTKSKSRIKIRRVPQRSAILLPGIGS